MKRYPTNYLSAVFSPVRLLALLCRFLTNLLAKLINRNSECIAEDVKVEFGSVTNLSEDALMIGIDEIYLAIFYQKHPHVILLQTISCQDRLYKKSHNIQIMRNNG